MILHINIHFQAKIHMMCEVCAGEIISTVLICEYTIILPQISI